jgi:uncharacterized protein YhfF
MAEHPHEALPIIELGFPGELRDRLIDAVMRGAKTATTGLLVEYELENVPVPQVGQRFAVVDSAEERVAAVEVTDVQVLALSHVDLEIARDEGEGFESVAQWRAAHEAFWNGYIDELRALLDAPDWKLADETLVLVQRFRLLD